MYKTGLDAADLVVNGLQAGKQLLDAKIAQGIDARRHALKSRQVQGHGSGGLNESGGQRELSCGLGTIGYRCALILNFNAADSASF